MAFTETELAELELLLAASDDAVDVAAGYRARFPGRSLTHCDARDMDGEKPYRRFQAVALYLVDGHGPCWRITGDPTAATGVVLARRWGVA